MKIPDILTSVAALGALLCAPAAVAQTKFATLYTFPDDNPVGLVYANGVFYGGSSGANSNCGTVFQLQPPAAPGAAWTETTLYSFPTGSTVDGCGPTGAPIVGPGGVLYGIAGSGPGGNGVIYELQPPGPAGGSWTETVIYSFGDGDPLAGPPTALLLGPNGSLYVTTGDGGLGLGALDQLLPPSVAGGAWTAVVLYSFAPLQDSSFPDSLARGPGGVLYGATAYGGPALAGGIFELFPPSTGGGAWTGSILYTFAGGADGGAPNGVILGPDGSLYGTTQGDILVGGGAPTVFQLTPPAAPGGIWTKTILKTFHNTNLDCGPDSPLILRHGKLYAATCQAGGGAVFELDPPSTPGGAWTSVTLHRFKNQQVPGGAMAMTSTGVIFGATALPSTLPPGGTIFEIVPK